MWRGAAGLCERRVRACAGATESVHTYVHTHRREMVVFTNENTLIAGYSYRIYRLYSP